MLRIRTSVLAIAALFLVACGPSGGPPPGFPPSEVAVVTVETRSLPAPIEYTGQTAGSREVEVRARVNGILQSRNFTEGARVARGSRSTPSIRRRSRPQSRARKPISHRPRRAPSRRAATPSA